MAALQKAWRQRHARTEALPIQDMATRERDDLRDAKAEEPLRRNKRMVARVEPPGVPDQKAFFR